MKIKLNKLLSALLVLCMIAGAFTVYIGSAALTSYAADTSEEEEEEEEIIGFDSEKFLLTSFASDEDKLKTMSIKTETGRINSVQEPEYTYAPYKTYKNLEMYVQEETGEVAVKNTETGQVIFTNPYDAAPKANLKVEKNGVSLSTGTYVNNKSALPSIFSQLILTFQTIRDGTTSTFNTFTDAASNNQITITQIKNGVSVEYTMGTVEERHLVPMYMEKYRFEKLILKNIRDDQTSDGKKAYVKLLSMYTRVYMNGEDGYAVNEGFRDSVEKKYPALAAYGPPENDRKWFVSDDYEEEKVEEYNRAKAEDDIARQKFETSAHSPDGPSYYISYFGIPYTGYMSMYTYGAIGGKANPEREYRLIEEWIRKYDPTYTFDDLEYDHKLTGYIKQNEAIPSFRMALEYTLTDEGFQVRLPANSILFDEDNFRLLSIAVLPYMGAGSYENTGYVFVPDGSGTLIRFEDTINPKNTVVFTTGTMFGPDNAYHSLPESFTGHEEIMRMPVYGVTETIEKTFDKAEDGSYSEACSHRWEQKNITADCTTKTNGGIFAYCPNCGAIEGTVRKYEHTWSTQDILQEQDCHHTRIFKGVCSKCLDKYQKLIRDLYTEEQILDEYGEIRWYIVDEGELGEHHYESYSVEIDGKCCTYWVCTTEYELLDENGNRIYKLDEEGNIVYKKDKDGKEIRVNGEKVPDYVTVRCGDVKKDPETGEILYEEGQHAFDQSISYVKDGHCYSEKTCRKCGYHQVDVDVHSYDAASSVRESRDGECYDKNICTVCGATVKIPAAHTYSDERTYVEDGAFCEETRTCVYCGHVEVTLREHVAEAAGELKYDAENHRCYEVCVCRNCKGTFEREAAHAPDESGVCVNCGYKLPQEEGHTYVETYIEVGGVCVRTFVCSDCGKEYADGAERIATEHAMTQVTESYACRAEGRSYFICTKCGYITDEKTIVNANPSAHSYEWVRDENASCLEGYDERYECSVCHDVAETKHTVGHVYSAPVRLIPGIESMTCTICGHLHYAQSEVIPDETPADPGASEGGENPADPAEGEDAKEQLKVKIDRGFMAIMTEGSTLASLTAATGGTESKYCRAYMTVTPRPQDTYNLRDAISTGDDKEWTVVSKRKYTGNYTLNVTMLQTVNDEKASAVGLKSSTYESSYSGMAKVYRTHLIESGILKPLDTDSKNIPLYLEAFGTISVSSTFLTFPITEKKALNTFDSLKSIIEDLGKEGIASSAINIKLKGFTNGGMNETMPYKVEFEEEAGGDDGYSAFLEYANRNGVGVYPDFDFAYMHSNKSFDGYTDRDHAVKTIDGRYIVKKEYDSTLQIFTGTGLLAVSSSVFDYFYQTFKENFGKYDNNGIAAVSLGDDLNSDFDKDDPYNREDSRKFTEELLGNLEKDFGSVMIEGGNEYALAYADHILNVSLKGSGFLKTSCSVPFMAMVLHGYVNYAGSATNMASSIDQEMLHIIENGASPYFIIASENTKYLKETMTLSKYYSLDYSTWKDDMISVYTRLNEVLGDTQNAVFEDHCFVEGIRVPDADEVEADKRQMIDTVKEAIAKYTAAKMRIENAEALYKRKFSDPKAALEEQIRAIISKYDWSVDQAELESVEIKLSEEDAAKLSELSAQYDELCAVIDLKSSDAIAVKLHTALRDDIAVARAIYENAVVEFESTMSRCEVFFNVAEENRLNPIAYEDDPETGASAYIGIFSENDGKIAITTDGVVDSEGNPITSSYTINNDSIVKVSYDNGVSIYLNYNYFDVIVKIDGENVRIPAYDYYKTQKGAN